MIFTLAKTKPARVYSLTWCFWWFIIIRGHNSNHCVNPPFMCCTVTFIFVVEVTQVFPFVCRPFKVSYHSWRCFLHKEPNTCDVNTAALPVLTNLQTRSHPFIDWWQRLLCKIPHARKTYLQVYVRVALCTYKIHNTGVLFVCRLLVHIIS